MPAHAALYEQRQQHAVELLLSMKCMPVRLCELVQQASTLPGIDHKIALRRHSHSCQAWSYQIHPARPQKDSQAATAQSLGCNEDGVMSNQTRQIECGVWRASASLMRRMTTYCESLSCTFIVRFASTLLELRKLPVPHGGGGLSVRHSSSSE